jgi:hypothetical protein
VLLTELCAPKFSTAIVPMAHSPSQDSPRRLQVLDPSNWLHNSDGFEPWKVRILASLSLSLGVTFAQCLALSQAPLPFSSTASPALAPASWRITGTLLVYLPFPPFSKVQPGGTGQNSCCSIPDSLHACFSASPPFPQLGTRGHAMTTYWVIRSLISPA